jgi:predicted transcriptional regulator
VVEWLRRAQAARRSALGRLEMAVLDRLWSAGEADVTAMHAAVGEPRALSRNTIQSTLERLARKGLAERTKVGREHASAARRPLRDHCQSRCSNET